MNRFCSHNKKMHLLRAANKTIGFYLWTFPLPHSVGAIS
uniref:Uncharacterized protein n=1 Tax=Myoviridae sp. ctXwe21 TaxID=2825123 RepID=A0A8S5PY48_9CAUD|nr:MAG TPA: hypothetical protein [Myoviridae sp. ctXwe21]